ncbi:MAG: electron transfer flavoprotein subunit beta/FixA family protein [Halodesulfurarchaeum sp.]|nr:electron transfer flavoprotein subunit beta/FixA family protein [Halodesulfurarchaeum sp.]
MKILVTFAEVAAVADNFEIEDGAVDERFLEYDQNEWDEYALEEAVSLREAGVADEVVLVTIGPERAVDTIRMGLAKGADRAIRIWDESLADGALVDVSSRAALLAPVIEEEDPTLVLSGVQAADDGYGTTGVTLARRLEYQWAAVVNELSLDPEDSTARVRRELEGGIEEVTVLDLPAVLTIQTGINDPRYASLRGLQEAQTQEIDVRTPADLGVRDSELESALELGDFAEPESKTDTEYVEGDPAEQATAIGDLLVEQGVIEE